MNFNNNLTSINEWENAYCYAHSYCQNDNVFYELPSAQVLLSHKAIDAFVSKASKSSAPPFTIEKDFEGIHLKKSTSLADCFYDALNANVDATFHPSRPSENICAFQEAWQQMELQKHYFADNPTNLIGHSTLSVAELVNNVTQRVRSITQRASIKKQKAGRIQLSRYRFAKVKRLIDRLKLQPNQPFGLYVARLDFEYQDSRTSLLTAHSQLKAFVSELEGRFKHAVVGYVWDRSYFEQVGYRHHFFLILNAQLLSTNEIKLCWSQITNNEGISFEFTPHIPHIKSSGCGYLSPQSYEVVLSALQSWIKLVEVLMLPPERDIEHFGVSQLPTPIKASMPIFGWEQSSPKPLHLPAPASPFPVTYF